MQELQELLSVICVLFIVASVIMFIVRTDCENGVSLPTLQEYLSPIMKYGNKHFSIVGRIVLGVPLMAFTIISWVVGLVIISVFATIFFVLGFVFLLLRNILTVHEPKFWIITRWFDYISARDRLKYYELRLDEALVVYNKCEGERKECVEKEVKRYQLNYDEELSYMQKKKYLISDNIGIAQKLQ